MDQPSIRVDHIGHERRPVVVIDDFSPHPDRLVDVARTLPFEPLGPYYPGVRAPVTPLYFEGLSDLLASVMREVNGAETRLSVDRALYSLATTPPERLSPAQRIPHVDGVEPELIAILHYLSPTDQGGTAFYRHRSTGFETITAARHRDYLDALKRDFVEHGEPPARYIDEDTTLFERTAAYAPTFNRALIYPGNLLHCARMSKSAALVADLDRGRLTVASFLRLV